MSIFKIFHRDFSTEEGYRAYLSLPFFTRQIVFHPVRTLFCLAIGGYAAYGTYADYIGPRVQEPTVANRNILSSHFIVQGKHAEPQHHVDVMPVAEFKTTAIGENKFALNGDSLINEARPVGHCEGSPFKVGEKGQTSVDVDEGRPFHNDRYTFYAREYFGKKDKWASMYQYDNTTGCLTLLDVDYENATKVFWGNRHSKEYYVDQINSRISSYARPGYVLGESEEGALHKIRLNVDDRFK